MGKLFKQTLYQKTCDGINRYSTSSVFRKMKIKVTMNCEGLRLYLHANMLFLFRIHDNSLCTDLFKINFIVYL